MSMKVIGLGGEPATGKTTLAVKLLQSLEGPYEPTLRKN
jgi:uridine kinase